MFKERFALLLVLLMVLLPLIAPAAEKAAPTWCNKCNMKIPDAGKKYSVTLTEGIEPMAFDDIGCSMLWRDGECAMRMSAFDSNARVYDYLTGEPVVIENAFFAYGPEIKTPMGYGIIAFKTREQAAAAAAQSGKAKVLTYLELTSLTLK
jgi:copper chaperone NosL